MSEIARPPAFSRRDWLRSWLQAAALGTALLVLLFAGYEAVERLWMRGWMPAEQLFAYHLYRGVGASILIGTVAVWSTWRSRRAYDQAFAAAYREVETMVDDRTRALLQLEAHVRYQEKLAALGVLAAGIAHDIGNPLASMSSELEMLEMEKDPAKVHDSIGVLRGQVLRIDRTLREMSEFARRRGDEVAEVRVRVAVDDALRLVRHDPRARKITFEVDVASDLPPLRLVEDHLVMVLVNLLINAFDALSDGGALTVRAREEPEGSVSISVADTGAGMTEAVRRRAAEPLFTTKGGGRGTGLGLTVSSDVVHAAGGELEIASEPRRGTTVTLRFPAGGAKSDA